MTEIVNIIKAPWTEDQVSNLNKRQEDKSQHPYTCDRGHELIATKDGWVCMSRAVCRYKQDWALTCDTVNLKPLKPCPFCGGTAMLCREERPLPNGMINEDYYVQCIIRECQIRTLSWFPAAAAEQSWNRRV